MRFRTAFAAIGVVLGFHALGVLYFYGMWHWYDVPMHFAGGAVMGLLAMAFWDRFVDDVTFTRKYPWLRRAFFTFCVMSFAALVGIGWEWFEFSFDMFVRPALPTWGIAQTSIADTMADLFFDLVGGFAVTVFRKKV